LEGEASLALLAICVTQYSVVDVGMVLKRAFTT
jgi:hypothetical protein